MIEKWSSATQILAATFCIRKHTISKKKTSIKRWKHTEKTFFRRVYIKGRQCTHKFQHALGAYGPGADFWPKWSPQGSILDPRGCPGGGQKSRFWAKSRHEIVKKSVQEGVQKKHRKIIKKWWQKYVFGEGKKVWNLWNRHQNSRFRRFARTSRNDLKTVMKNRSKSPSTSGSDTFGSI